MEQALVFIGGEWRAAASPVGTFQAVNPATREQLPAAYPVSSSDDIEAAVAASAEAVKALRAVSPEQIARFLERFADEIEGMTDPLVEMAHQETALPADTRLRSVELPRTTNQLRQAAAAARDGSWARATIDTKTNIRSMYGPLNGAVVVFGPNNFPYAFNGIGGGDFAAAIAAGNPVIGKANPAHPGTTRLLAQAAHQAAQATDMPAGMVQMIYHMEPETGLALVSHPDIGATAFTGSRGAGLALKAAADKAGKPIYLEMSSINPVVMMPGALRERAADLAGEFAASCTLGTGQFCTNPGLVLLINDDHGKAFVDMVKVKFESMTPGVLLTERGPRDIARGVDHLVEHGAQVVTGGSEVGGEGYRFQNTLLTVPGPAFLQEPNELQREVFGPVSLFVLADTPEQIISIVETLEGNLTGSIYSAGDGTDEDFYAALEPVLRPKVGRLLNDKMPTGVAVSPGMNHGGPYPATGHPGFTAVGIPAAMVRFAALYSYDNVREHRLPPALRNANPTGALWRYIDGAWTQGNVA